MNSQGKSLNCPIFWYLCWANYSGLPEFICLKKFIPYGICREYLNGISCAECYACLAVAEVPRLALFI